MKPISTLLLFFLISLSQIYSQSNSKIYSTAFDFYNEGEYSAAIEKFQLLLTKENIDEELFSSANFYIGESYLGIDQQDAAIFQFEYFVKTFITSEFRDLALFRLGNLYFRKDLYDLSRLKLVTLINEYPNSEYSGSAYHLIGETFIEENNLDKAEDFFSSAINSRKSNFYVDNSIYSLATLYEKKGEYEKAVNYYDRLLGHHKNSDLSALAQLRIGVCYFYLGEYDNAILELSDPLIKELDKKQQNEADYILANSFYRLREYDNATQAYKRILNNYPSANMLERIRYGLAWIHFRQKNFNDAYKLFNMLSYSKDDSIAMKSLYWSAESKRYAGKYGESIEIYKNFVSKYPAHPYSDKVKLNIGISKFSQNSLVESEDALLESINSDDNITKAKALTILGEIKLRKKEFERATEYFERGILIPHIPAQLNDRCYLGLGVSNFFKKNNIEAIKYLSEIDVSKTEVDKDKLLFYKGEVNFFLGNYQEALNNYNKIVTSDVAISKNALYGKAYSYFNLKDFGKAVHYFSEFLKLYSNDERISECQLRLADSYFGIKSFAKASSYYKLALLKSDKFSNDDRSFFNYSQSLFKEGKSSEAISSLQNFQLRFPASQYTDQAQYLIGWIYFQDGNFEEAINNYSKLIDNYPQSSLVPIAYYSIGDSYFNFGNYAKAIESYNKIITNFSNSQYVYDAINGIQYCYVVQEKQNEAINYLKLFIKNNSGSNFLDKIQFKIAEIYYSSGEYQKALEAYSELVDIYPSSRLIPSAYYWMGKSTVLLGNHNSAIEYFENVINDYLNTEEGFNSVVELGKIYRQSKQYDQEIELYSRVLPEITLTKKVNELKLIMAQNYIEQNNISSAYQVLNEIVDSRDGSLFYYKAEIELGILELVRNKYENSLYLFSDVVNNREDDIAAQGQYYIGYTYFEQDKMPEAITELIKLRSLYSGYDEWYTKGLILLGDCYVKINEKGKASEMYKAVLKRHRNDTIAIEVREKLNNL